MASYTRFEVYLPVHYVVTTVDPGTGERVSVRHALDDRLVSELMQESVERFGGATQAHPMGNPPARGLWKSREFGDVAVDDLTHLFVQVPVHQFDEALAFFDRWQARLAEATWQEAILVSWWPVNTIGGFL